MKKLPIQFYKRSDVVLIAKELIGKIIVTNLGGTKTTGRIVETEAYIGITDRASHSYAGKRTARNEHMYSAPGTAYVYICYGTHHLFNIVCNEINIPDAVLIRAVQPLTGTGIMLQRAGKQKAGNTLTKGPGNAARALGISKIHSGISLLGNEIYLTDDGTVTPSDLVASSKRIGIESSGDAVSKPYRFYIKGNPFVSGYPNK